MHFRGRPILSMNGSMRSNWCVFCKQASVVRKLPFAVPTCSHSTLLPAAPTLQAPLKSAFAGLEMRNLIEMTHDELKRRVPGAGQRRRAVSMQKRVRNREEEQGGERETDTEELSCCLQTAGGESE